ncbi:MAG: polysaccharide deacetylase family protein [Desulfobacterales bacterium]|nr:MAG: polysaccharide deacetylase family protein [Desulfobacterales bacterium]
MQRSVSSIWQRLPPDLATRIKSCIVDACEQASGPGEAYIFFRADDIAAPGNRFRTLLEVFSFHRAPLCLAVVPAWLTPARWKAIEGIMKNDAHLWCWHQHGWRHANHAIEGKKQEFGPQRTPADLAHDMRRGHQRLRSLMGRSFYPVFTPPWNRCGHEALATLKRSGYLAVSRSRGSRPPSPPGLPSFDVDVDLHTRKEESPKAGWDNLFNELQRAISEGCCGIMIHHQRMNTAAFVFLDVLLKVLKTQTNLQLVHFKDLLYKTL